MGYKSMYIYVSVSSPAAQIQSVIPMWSTGQNTTQGGVSDLTDGETKISYKEAKAASSSNQQSFNSDLSYSDEDLELFELIDY